MPKKSMVSDEEEAFHPLTHLAALRDQEAQEEEEAREGMMATPSGRFAMISTVNLTKFEKKVWTFLGKNLNPWGFQIQVDKFGYLLDFYSDRYLLAIEADGPDHVGRVQDDMHRDQVLLERGIRTLRLQPVDFVRNSRNQLIDLIEEFIHPRHVPKRKI